MPDAVGQVGGGGNLVVSGVGDAEVGGHSTKGMSGAVQLKSEYPSSQRHTVAVSPKYDESGIGML